VLKTREFTVEIEKIHAGENPLRLEGENKGIAEPAESISRIGLINPVGYIYSYRARMRLSSARRTTLNAHSSH